ncbi:hypothetical protein Cantr_03684 [Candida viswanathii]|uniref:Uncharacterized protein n=1 Tax=Candida viswanathii TaxID=5486 RepID=A0A367XNG1_9ASCO|nr:hypothetical protein Cantr_03684 [Candida viswanathii]
MRLIYFLFLAVVIAEGTRIPRVYSDFVTSEDEQDDDSEGEPPAKGFSIKDFIFWYRKHHKHDETTDGDHSTDGSDCENPGAASDHEECVSGQD